LSSLAFQRQVRRPNHSKPCKGGRLFHPSATPPGFGDFEDAGPAVETAGCSKPALRAVPLPLIHRKQSIRRSGPGECRLRREMSFESVVKDPDRTVRRATEVWYTDQPVKTLGGEPFVRSRARRTARSLFFAPQLRPVASHSPSITSRRRLVTSHSPPAIGREGLETSHSPRVVFFEGGGMGHSPLKASLERRGTGRCLLFASSTFG
jgi:hypothetical protein